MSNPVRGPIGLELSVGASPERADAARNRQLLLTAAQELVDSQGAAAVSMDAVARAAGVGKGTVFRRFGSRNGLMMALLDQAETQLQEQYLAGPPPIGPGAPPLDRLIAYGRARIALTIDHLELLTEIVSVEFMSHPAGAASYRHVQFLLRDIGFGTDNQVLAVALHAPLNAGPIHHLMDADGLDAATIADRWEQMVRTLVRGLPDR